MSRVFDPTLHCGAHRRSDDLKGPGRKGQPCRQFKGYGTDHPGTGHCKLHGGMTPTGQQEAARERAAAAASRLGVPVGSGDPFALLTKVVQHAEGHLEASAALVREARDAAIAEDSKATSLFDLAAATELLEHAIATGARVGKAAVDADVADRRAAIDERAENLMWRFISTLFDRYVPADRRQEAETFAAGLLTELAGEYGQSQAVVH